MNDGQSTRLNDLRAALTRAGCEVLALNGSTGGEWDRRWNGALATLPALVARPADAVQVGEAIRAAREAGLAVSVHSGGQDWVGRSLRDGSLVIDLSCLTKVFVDAERREATCGGGVTTGELNRVTGEHGLVAVIGNDGAVGVAGLLLGGGYGPLMTRFGLACDSLLSAEVVLADGTVVTCDATRHADLFWALRGGGGNFGVVTAVRVRLHAPGPVFTGSVVFPWADARAALGRYATTMLRAPAELFGAAVLSAGPGGQPVLVVSLVWTGEPVRGDAIMAEIASAGTPLLAKAAPMPASGLLSLTDGKLPQGRGYEVATRWLAALTPEAIEALACAFEARTSPLSTIIIHHCHGAATEIAPEATAFGMRQPHFTALIYAAWEPAANDAGPHQHWARRLAADLALEALPGGYANLLADRSDQVASAYGGNAARLLSTKARFDPTAVFSATPLPGRVS